ncbi:DUF6965 family protein [Dyadobacter alkalitolerans]|uniref:DUF6965 family protein n=1 Tax=Dyadobacter alkalitolerans TaxID=492736 RepID=UPI00041F94D3|nr:hypothetical protein [Dyadobacter alkalitolerans]
MSVEELEEYFRDRPLPKGPVKMNNYSTITDPKAFIEAELYILNQNQGRKIVDSCRLRLIEFRNWLEANPQ